MTSQDVIERLRPVFERAVAEGRGAVSYVLSKEEQALFGEAERAALEAETGFDALCDQAGQAPAIAATTR